MSGQLVAVSDWLGHHGEPLEPSAMQFTIKPATSCRGCLFNGQRSRVCNRAVEVAQRAELPHCEEGFIYVTRESDPRQLTIDS